MKIETTLARIGVCANCGGRGCDQCNINTCAALKNEHSTEDYAKHAASLYHALMPAIEAVAIIAVDAAERRLGPGLAKHLWFDGKWLPEELASTCDRWTGTDEEFVRLANIKYTMDGIVREVIAQLKTMDELRANQQELRAAEHCSSKSAMSGM